MNPPKSLLEVLLDNEMGQIFGSKAGGITTCTLPEEEAKFAIDILEMLHPQDAFALINAMNNLDKRQPGEKPTMTR